MGPEGSRNPERFIPFGFGKRSCMGENLAKAELFIFTVMILQHLNIGESKVHGRPDETEVCDGITRAPRPFHISITAR
jgi:cytochrome P450